MEKKSKTQQSTTKVFANTKIFISAKDYILGGFEKDDLENIEIEGEDDPVEIFKRKLKVIFLERVGKMFTDYEREIAENLMDGSDDEPDEDLLNESFTNGIKNMLDTYLGITPYNVDMDSLIDQLTSHPAARSWLDEVCSRVNNESLLGEIDENQVTAEEAEDYTYNTSLEQIFEQLCSLNR